MPSTPLDKDCPCVEDSIHGNYRGGCSPLFSQYTTGSFLVCFSTFESKKAIKNPKWIRDNIYLLFTHLFQVKYLPVPQPPCLIIRTAYGIVCASPFHLHSLHHCCNPVPRALSWIQISFFLLFLFPLRHFPPPVDWQTYQHHSFNMPNISQTGSWPVAPYFFSHKEMLLSAIICIVCLNI